MATEILNIDDLISSQASKEITVNENMRQLEAMLVRALSRTSSGPPVSPVSGDTYIIDSNSGVWGSGSINDIAHFYNGNWKFYTPIGGLTLIVIDENNARLLYSGTDWIFQTLAIYTVATLPSASVAGQMIYVSDEAGGAVIAFSDGVNWLRMTDRAVVA